MIGFWIFMLLMSLLIPAIMIGFGQMFLKAPPKDINAAFGYRTKENTNRRGLHQAQPPPPRNDSVVLPCSGT